MDKRKRPHTIVRLKVSGEEIVSKGRSLEEALFKMKVGKLTTKGILTVESDGKKSKDIMLMISQIKKMFVQGLSGEIQRAIILKKIKLLGGM